MNFQKQAAIFSFLISFFIFSITIFGQNNVQWIGAWQFGPSDAVYVDTESDIAFLGSGGAVMIVDISNPEEPLLINDDIRTQGFVKDIWFEEDVLYLACGTGGLVIWNVTDLNNPAMISQTDILYFDEVTPVDEVEIYQDYAVLMCNWGYVHTVDIYDPYNPEQLHFNGQMGNPAHHIHVDEFGTIHTTGAQYYVRLTIGAGGSLNNAGSKEFLYGAGNLYGREEEAFVYYSGNLYILDLTLPGFPAWSITEATFSDIYVDEGIAYLVNGDGFEIWDVSDVHNPFMMSSVAFSFGNELFINDQFAYVSADHEGLVAIDIYDLNNPQIAGQMSAFSWSPNFDMAGGIGYLANGSGLITIELSDPYGSGPEEMDHLPTAGQTNDVAIMEDLAFIADWTGGLRIVDVSDPGNITEMSSVPIQAWKVAAGNGHVFVAEANPNFPDTLKIYDVSNPALPVMVASYTLPEDAYDMEYAAEYLYIANNDSGLRVFDVSDPTSPDEVSWVDLPWVLDVDIEGNTAYIASADWEGGLVSVDITDPENPEIMQIYNPSGWFHPFHVGASWPYAYASDIYGEVYVFDVSDPTNMIELETLTLPADILNIMAENEFIYVSDGQAGLQILKNDLVTGIDFADRQEKNPSIEINVYPNPSPGKFSFELINESKTKTFLDIYDISGKHIKNLLSNVLELGIHQISWNGLNESGNSVDNGIYFYRFYTNSYSKSGLLIRRD